MSKSKSPQPQTPQTPSADDQVAASQGQGAQVGEGDQVQGTQTDQQTQGDKDTATDTGPVYPRRVAVTNNTPIPLYLSEARVSLAANFHAPRNTADVVYQTPDAFAREQANVAAIAGVHGFSDPLLVKDAE